MMKPARVILAMCWLPALVAAAAPSATQPSASTSPPPPPSRVPALPAGAFPPAPHAQGMMPPSRLPNSAVPPGAFSPAPRTDANAPIAYDLAPVPDDVRERLAAFQRLYDEGGYAALIEQLNARLVEIKRAKAPANVTELARIHVLRGESYLQLRNQPQAVAAFKDAAAAATTGPGKARPTSLVLLIQRSKQLAYTPKSVNRAESGPIDIVAARDRAMQALLADELDRVRPKVSRAPRTLAQVYQMIDATADARTIELGSTGAAQQTAMLLVPAAQQARQLVQSALADMEAEAGFIKNRANTQRRVVGPSPPQKREENYHPTGLRDGDRAALDRIAESCAQVSTVCAALAAAFPAEMPTWRSINETANRVRTEAEQTRDANYQPQKITY